MRFDDEGNRRWWPKGNHNTEDEALFATWIRKLETEGKWAKLQKIYGELNTHGKSFHTLRAASLVKRILDQRAEANNPTAPPADLTRLTITDLPRDRWWKLFIDKSEHGANNPLRFDSQQSPGFYNMMMSAFETELPGAYNNPQAMNFQSYDAYHVLVTRGAVRRTRGGDWEAVPHELSGRDVQFPMTMGAQPEARALGELIAEGLAGTNREQIDIYNNMGMTVFNGLRSLAKQAQLRRENDLGPSLLGLYVISRDEIQQTLVAMGSPAWNADMNKFAKAAYLTARVEAQGGGFLSRFNETGTQVLVRTDIPESSAAGAVNQIFARYNREVNAGGATRRDKIRAICKAVRALHVGHFFADANGRLNTMLILNRLLMEQGFSPAIVQDTSWFGGSKSVDTLADMVEAGIGEFKEEVRVAHNIPLPAPVHLRARARSLERVRTATAPSGAVPRRRARSFSGSSL